MMPALIEANRHDKSRLVVITNGNYFARLVLGSVLTTAQWEVVAVLTVTGDYQGRSMAGALPSLWRKSTVPYLAYKATSMALCRILEKFYPGEFEVASFAARNGIQTRETLRVNEPDIEGWLRDLRPDLLVSVSCPQRIKRPILAIPEIASLNIHASLLPQFAGLAPYFWVLAEGEGHSGITVHYMTERFDAGNILAQRNCKILPRQSAFSLFEDLCRQGEKLLAEAVCSALKRETGKGQSLEARSYYSHPTWKAYRQLKRNRHRLMTFQDILAAVREARKRLRRQQGG